MRGLFRTVAVCCAVPALTLPSAASGASTMAWSQGIKVAPPSNAATGNAGLQVVAVSCTPTGDCAAVGRYSDALRRNQGFVMNGTAGTWSAASQVTLPAGAAANPLVALTSVSCASAGNCAAVGTYRDSGGNTQGLLVTQTSGTWSNGITASLPPTPAADPHVTLKSVSCPSAGNCVAVGSYADNNSYTQGLLLAQTSGTWGTGVRATPPLDANTNPSIDLTSVSCPSAGNCTAVGNYLRGTGTEAMGVSVTAGTWGPASRVLAPSGADPADPHAKLTSVACPTTTECSAVGSYIDSSGYPQGLLARQVSGLWQRVQATPPGDAATNPQVALTAVSCPSAGECTAVGVYTNGSGPQGMLLTETSNTWATASKAGLPAGAATNPNVTLSSVSCVSAGNCSAVGNYTESPNRVQGVYLTQSAGSWASGVRADLPAGASSAAPGVVLNSVSCSSAGNCAAGGSYTGNSSPVQGLIATQASGTWTTGITPTPPANAGGIQTVTLRSVSCVSAGNCTAIGTYVDSTGALQGLMATQTAGTWATGIEAALPPDADTIPLVQLGTVSCASAGNCTAVGIYQDTSNHTQGLLLTQTNGTWSTAAKATLPASTATDPHVLLQSVSCGSPGNCAAVGTYLDASNHTQGLLLTQTNGTWANGVAAVVPAGAAADPSVVLSSVSCTSSGSCVAVGSYKDGSSNQRGLLLTESSGTWANGVEPMLPATADASHIGLLSSVSCPPAGGCTAVGIYYDSAPALAPYSVSESSGVWGTGIAVPLPANSSVPANAFLGSAPCTVLGNCAAVSCPSAGNCATVGTYHDTGLDTRGLLANQSAGTWATGVQATLPAGGAGLQAQALSSVSCGSPGSCASVSSYTDGSGNTQGLLLGQAAGVWGAGIQATLPTASTPNPLVLLWSVSCVSGGVCTAVGSYVDNLGQPQGLIVSATTVDVVAPPAGGGGSGDGGGSGGGGGGGGTPPGSNPAPGVIKLLTKTAIVSKNVARVVLSCTGAGPCAGRLRVRIPGKRTKKVRRPKPVVIARASYSIQAGKRMTKRLKLNAKGRRALARKPRGLRTTAVLTPTGGKASKATLTLKRKAAKKKHG